LRHRVRAVKDHTTTEILTANLTTCRDGLGSLFGVRRGGGGIANAGTELSAVRSHSRTQVLGAHSGVRSCEVIRTKIGLGFGALLNDQFVGNGSTSAQLSADSVDLWVCLVALRPQYWGTLVSAGGAVRLSTAEIVASPIPADN
jgi:hypothetical protein